ncbi:hypothetical protein Tsubulata_020658 [Turnera subulata]|uniref:DUF7722 domain-containing protein n=1 Tax=Turnera subulata TaxID=218843 RepID=A0A9Q0JN04_9ROSI|nr:hypothetical protein Tsubulata_020658 [Turnera subulata]
MGVKCFVHSVCHLLGYSIEETKHLDQRRNIMAAVVKAPSNSNGSQKNIVYDHHEVEAIPSGFQMPLHYPRYTKADYQTMQESTLDILLRQYGLSFQGSLEDKRNYAMGTFLWPDQY